MYNNITNIIYNYRVFSLCSELSSILREGEEECFQGTHVSYTELVGWLLWWSWYNGCYGRAGMVVAMVELVGWLLW